MATAPSASSTCSCCSPTGGETTDPVAPPDFDGDTTVGILDLLILLAAWHADPGGPPDFDADGTVGILDLLTLLVNWGPCQ